MRSCADQYFGTSGSRYETLSSVLSRYDAHSIYLGRHVALFQRFRDRLRAKYEPQETDTVKHGASKRVLEGSNAWEP